MTSTTRRIFEHNLNQRLELTGPADELKELKDTIDELLTRLEGAFDGQRLFVANASHELRTPLAVNRAMLEMTLDDPDATLDTFRTTCTELLQEAEHQERLIDALLVLARSQRGLEQRTPLDLATITGQVLRALESDATTRGIGIHAALARADIHGDGPLITRLVDNLIENALRYNQPGGNVEVRTANSGGRAQLTVSNTGQTVDAAQIDRLLQPFQRLTPQRQAEPDSQGLGLSIVQAVTTAHEAELSIHSRSGGGLHIDVTFPVSCAPIAV